jgi:signal transduction histidine kinase
MPQKIPKAWVFTYKVLPLHNQIKAVPEFFVKLQYKAYSMKYCKPALFFIISLCLFIGCVNKSPVPESMIISKNNSILRDSINKLESLVNAKKASDNQLAKVYAKRALSLALQVNTEDALAQSFLILGIAYKNFNNDSSFIFYSKALKIVERFNLERIKPKLIYNLAMIYLAASDHKSSIIYLDSAINVANRVKDFELLSNGYNALGSVKLSLMDTLESKVLFDSAYNIARRHNLSRQLGVAIASLSIFEPNPSTCLQMRQNAIWNLKKTPGNEEEIALIHINIGMNSTNPDSAIAHYESAILVANSGNSPEVEIAAYNNLTYSLIDKNDFKQAENCLTLHAIPLAKKLENYEWLSSLYDSYADVMLAAGKMNQAFAHERTALKMRIKADRKQASDQVRLLAALLDVKNKELRIQTNERELQKKEYKVQLIIYLFSISLMLLFLTIFLYNWKIQRNKIEFQSSLLNSAKRLIDIEENMKGRVAMELHDLTSPFYTVMLQQIEKAKIGDSKIEDNLKSRLSTMTESIRQISHRMNNNFIGQLSLTELVKGLCEDLQSTSAVPIHCKIQLKGIITTSEETIHIYRIVQELLTNAIKYVTFGEVKLSLLEESGMFLILYQDSGPGFDAKNIRNKGLGIMNIFERSKIINGKAVLTTFPDKGTKWNIEIPHKEV